MTDRRHEVPESIGAMFRARVEQAPDSPFLVFEGQRWTHAEAFAEARRFAAHVRGVTGGVDHPRVVAYLGNSARAVFAWLGTQLAGGIFVALNRSQRGRVLDEMIVRAAPDLFVAEDEDAAVRLAGVLGAHVPIVETGSSGESTSTRSSDVGPIGSPPTVGRVVPWSGLPVDPIDVVVERGPSDIAGILYTSGTTGRSKAVLMTHAQYCRGGAFVASSLGLTAADVAHLWVPLFHVAGQVDLAMAHLVVGGSLAVFPTFSRSGFVDQIRGSGGTVSLLFPSLMRGLLDDRGTDEVVDSPLRIVIAAHVPAGLGDPFETTFGARLFDVYGMTEAEPLAAPRWDDTTPEGSCGRANPDFELAILDPHDRPLPPGRYGEIAARPRVPDVLSPGYEGDEAHSLAGRRNLWFHTGDLGMIDADGYVHFKERMGNAIRVKGENVSAWEVEREVLRHPDVRECAAVGIPNIDGEDDVKIVVTWNDGVVDPADTAEVEALHDWCRAVLARFMVPRYIEVRRELPYTETAKVKRSELRGVDPALVWDARATVDRVH